MKLKNLLLSTVLFVLLFSSFLKVKGQGCSVCLTNSLNIHTGYNHANSTFYSTYGNDEYWTLADGPSAYGPYPKCAISGGQGSNGITGATISTRINANIGGFADGNMKKGVNACDYDGDVPYKFVRQFCVNNVSAADNAKIQFRFLPDNCVSSIRIIGPSGNFLVTVPGLCYTQSVHTLPIFIFPVTSGVYTIEILMGNDWSNAGSWLNPNWVQTALSLQVEGTLTCTSNNKIFSDNKHFGKNPFCSPAYVNMDTPKFINYCIPQPGNTGTVTITNFNPVFTYSINSGNINTTIGTFPGTLGSTYTVTVADGTGCTVSSSVTIVPNNLNFTVTPNTLQCVPAYTTATVNFSIPTGGTPPYSWVSSAGGGTVTLFPPSSTTYTVLPSQDNHIYTVTDINGCSKQKTVTVGNLFGINNLATPPCANPGKITTLVNNTSGSFSGPITCKVNSLPYGTSNISYISNAGTYTITAKDIYGCTATNTIQMFPNPVVSSSTSYNTCPPNTTVLPNGLTNYQWSLPYPSAPSNLNYKSIGNCTSSLSASGYNPYTVTATDAQGCTGSVSNTYIENPFCCDCISQCPTMQYYPTAWNITSSKKFSSLPPYNNGNAAGLIAAFGSNVITTNAYILIDRYFQINQNITFLNCPNILFTEGARINVVSNATLTIDNCKLRSLCHDMLWDGIYGVGNGTGNLTNNTKLIIRNSEFKDMKNGILAANGAVLNCDNNYFKNNAIGLQITNSPAGYNYVNGNCMITNNTFTSENVPCGVLPVGETGIRVKDCKEVAIGVLDFATKTNYFTNIRNGIYISSSLPNQNEKYYVYDNHFENILAPASAQYGCGIYADCIPTTSANHTLYVRNAYENVSNTPKFINCNNSVYTKYVSANIQETRSTDCKNGFIFDNALNQLYYINTNFIQGNTLLGMSFNGNTNIKSLVENNAIQLSTTPIGSFFPSGIKVNFNAPNTSNGITFNYNTIEIRANAGTGFSLLKTNVNTLLYYNTVNNTNLTPSPLNNGGTNFSSLSSAHYDISNCNGTRLIENRSNGSNALLTGGVNNVEGMRITSSMACEFSCNRFNKTRIGTMVVGNSAGTTFRGNKYNSHGNSLRFQDIGGGASIGDIGSFTVDNNNQFTSGSLFVAPFNFTLFRFATNSAFSSSIFTNLSITSGSNLTGNAGKYNIVAPGSSASIYNQCLAAKMANPEMTYTETDAVEIANETGQYAEFSEVAKWIEDGKLYCEIAKGDINLLNNSTIYTFFEDQKLTYRDELYNVDRMIGELSDSVVAEDTTRTFEEKIAPIEQLNNAIVSTNELEANEQFINKLYLQWLRGGADMIDSTDSIELEIMAWSCPMEKGTAVYKARSIYSSINPSASFDDITLCSTGLNKNSTQQEGTIDMNMVNNLLADNLSIYPNPATDEVTIDYVLPENNQGKITIFDMLGRARMTLDLSATNNRAKFSVANLEKGVYIYKYIVNTKVVKTDKLTVE